MERYFFQRERQSILLILWLWPLRISNRNREHRISTSRILISLFETQSVEYLMDIWAGITWITMCQTQWCGDDDCVGQIKIPAKQVECYYRGFSRCGTENGLRRQWWNNRRFGHLQGIRAHQIRELPWSNEGRSKRAVLKLWSQQMMLGDDVALLPL